MMHLRAVPRGAITGLSLALRIGGVLKKPETVMAPFGSITKSCTCQGDTPASGSAVSTESKLHQEVSVVGGC